MSVQLDSKGTQAFLANECSGTQARVYRPSMSGIAASLPANVKLMTVSNNYAAWNDGQVFSHPPLPARYPILPLDYHCNSGVNRQY
jgi:hypothetical protein